MEEEGIGKLVFVDEEVGWQREVRVEFAAGIWWREVLCREGQGECWVEARGVGKGCCVGQGVEFRGR